MRKVKDFLYEEESYKIRGSCFAVYNVLGGGIRENIICRALQREFLSRGLTVTTQARIDIIYHDQRIGSYIPDFVIGNRILVEVKSKPFVSKEDEKQFWGYLKGSKHSLGFLVNFGPKQLVIKRFAHTHKTV